MCDLDPQQPESPYPKAKPVLEISSSSFAAFSSSKIPDVRQFPVNSKVDPCENFYEYACSRAVNDFTLRDDRSRHIFAFNDSRERLLNTKKEFLQKLQLEHKVKITSGKLSTTALSQGQRKRLALLNAYLEDRPIYLFDEWASDQDPMFREIFYTQLLQELKNRGKTLLVISHDDHYFHLADRIIKLDYGQVEYDKKGIGDRQ